MAGTQGKILTYDNKPIEASFFSTSNGYTENAEAYWTSAIPYLKSVKSPWDKQSPKYLATQTFSVPEFQQKLGVQLSGQNTVGQITARTPGHQVATAVINGKKLKGRDIREKLGLRSADFEWKRNGGDHHYDKRIRPRRRHEPVRGQLHGGAGKISGGHRQALLSGVDISEADSFLNKYMAKK